MKSCQRCADQRGDGIKTSVLQHSLLPLLSAPSAFKSTHRRRRPVLQFFTALHCHDNGALFYNDEACCEPDQGNIVPPRIADVHGCVYRYPKIKLNYICIRVIFVNEHGWNPTTYQWWGLYRRWHNFKVNNGAGRGRWTTGGYSSSTVSSPGNHTMLQHPRKFNSFVPLRDVTFLASTNTVRQGMTKMLFWKDRFLCRKMCS